MINGSQGLQNSYRKAVYKIAKFIIHVVPGAGNYINNIRGLIANPEVKLSPLLEVKL